MLRPLFAFLCCACASAPPQPAISRTALQGVTVAIPTPEDGRASTSAGCGQFAPDLPQRIEKALIASLGDAGAQIARNAPLAVRASKEIIAHAQDWPEQEAWQRQDEIAGPVMTSDDAREGAKAFAEKRPPEWQGR